MKRILGAAAFCAAMALTLAANADQKPAQPATLHNDLAVRFVDQTPADRVASKLIGASIKSKAGDTIGTLSDIVIDESNKLRSYVVSVGGFLGLNAKYVAVDPSAVAITIDDKGTPTIVIDTNQDQLRAAPEYRYLGQKTNEK